MRLKKLEVVGFKSFLEKTSFSFEVPITSIVGPNGCGKSNVVDALKWVTGELSSKELRGKSMEDLIFAGSELRPPTSMMEVALTLENTMGLAPAQYNDFTEITVMRRVFRDGSSEFYINKTECRLKDILDLFLDTGIGQSSYSIIEQGRIGAIVSGRSEDRRLIIEEAAGITKFKHRRQAAQRKMEATKQNLLRVTDIIQEIKRQIGSLERQAQKAEKFRVIREQAKELDLSLLARDYLHGKQTLIDLQKDEETILQSNQTDESQLIEHENNYEQIKISLLEQEKLLEESQQKLFEKKSDVQNTENRIQSEYREIEFLEKQNSENRERSNFLNQEYEDSQKKILEFSAEKEQLQIELATLESQLHEGIQAYQLTTGELTEIEKQLEEEKKAFLSTATQEASTVNQLRSYQNRLDEIENRYQEIQNKLNQLEQESKKLKEACGQQKETLQQVTQLRFDFENSQEALKSEIEKLQENKQSTTASLSEVNQKLEGYSSRLATLEEFIQSYRGYRKGVRTVMENKSSIGGVLALVGEVIHPQRGYERAVQAALSELIECVLVDQRQNATEIIDYLKKNAGGRGTFISKVALFSSRDLDLTHMNGVKGWLTDFIRVDDSYDSFVRGLLSSTLLVDTLENAISIWESGTHINMVTPAGDRVTEKGFISGGDWSEETGVLEIHNQAQEIRENISIYQEKQSSLSNELETISKKLVTKQAELKDVQAGLDRESKKSVDVEREFRKLEEALKILSSKQEFLVQDGQKFQVEKEQILSSQKDLEETRSKLAEVKAQSEQRQTAYLTQLSHVKSVAGEQNQIATELKIRKASILERFESFERETQNLVVRSQNALSEKDLLQKTVSENETSIRTKRELIETFEKDKIGLIESYQDSEKFFQNARTEYDKKVVELNEVESLLKALRQQKEALVEQVNLLRMQIQEQTLKLERVREQSVERYAVDIDAHVTQESFVILEEERVAEISAQVQELKEKMQKIGDVNLGAIGELEELKNRFEFLTNQKADLEKSLEDLTSAIRKINSTTKEMFTHTFDSVNAKFQELFPHLFRGGKAKLVLTNPEEILESGIDIVAQPPGKKLQNMNLLSGGEKALTAIALLFAIFEFKAPPVCVLDEVDAPLDEVNVGRFLEMVKTMSQKTQFIIITHNKNTMEIADNLYGVTMEEPGVSRIVSVRVQKIVEHAMQKEPQEAAVAS